MKIRIVNYWTQKNPRLFTLFQLSQIRGIYSMTILNFAITLYTEQSEWVLHI